MFGYVEGGAAALATTMALKSGLAQGGKIRDALAQALEQAIVLLFQQGNTQAAAQALGTATATGYSTAATQALAQAVSSSTCSSCSGYFRLLIYFLNWMCCKVVLGRLYIYLRISISALIKTKSPWRGVEVT